MKELKLRWIQTIPPGISEVEVFGEDFDLKSATIDVDGMVRIDGLDYCVPCRGLENGVQIKDLRIKSGKFSIENRETRDVRVSITYRGTQKAPMTQEQELKAKAKAKAEEAAKSATEAESAPPAVKSEASESKSDQVAVTAEK